MKSRANRWHLVPHRPSVLLAAGACAALFVTVTADAAEPPQLPPNEPTIHNTCDPKSPAPDICYIRKGTEVDLQFDELVTTENRKAKIGSSFELSTVSPVTIDDHIIIPSGTKALGQVDYVDYKGGWGHNATLSVRVLYLNFSGQHVPISAIMYQKGKGGAWAIAPASAVAIALTGGTLLAVSGPLATGASAKIKRGQFIRASISIDLPIDMSDLHHPNRVTANTKPLGE